MRLARLAGYGWAAINANPNALVFLAGLLLLCGSVAQWSTPLAGALAGGVLMMVAVWPFVIRRSQ